MKGKKLPEDAFLYHILAHSCVRAPRAFDMLLFPHQTIKTSEQLKVNKKKRYKKRTQAEVKCHNHSFIHSYEMTEEFNHCNNDRRSNECMEL